MKGNYYIYILSNKKRGVLYIGVTRKLSERIYEHKKKILKGFSKKYNTKNLVYLEHYSYIEDAIKREKQLKNWHRAWKINLIEKTNPEWLDLSIS